MIGTRVNGVVAAELRETQGGPGGAGRWGKIVGLAGKVSTDQIIAGKRRGRNSRG